MLVRFWGFLGHIKKQTNLLLSPSCVWHSLVSEHHNSKRIWPLSDFLGVLPHHVVLAEDEERSVDGEAVLPDWNGVVQGHGARALRFGLLEGWGDPTCRHSRSIPVPIALWTPVSRTQQAGDLVSKTGHSVKKIKQHRREDGMRRGEEEEEAAALLWRAGRGGGAALRRKRAITFRESSGMSGKNSQSSEKFSQKYIPKTTLLIVTQVRIRQEKLEKKKTFCFVLSKTCNRLPAVLSPPQRSIHMLNKPPGNSSSALLWWPPSFPCALPHCCLRNSATEKELCHFLHDLPSKQRRKKKYLSHIEQRKNSPRFVCNYRIGESLCAPRDGKAERNSGSSCDRINTPLPPTNMRNSKYYQYLQNHTPVTPPK